MSEPRDDHLRDAVGRRRSPATFSSFRKGRPPGNKGKKTGGLVYDTEEVLRLLGAIPTSAPAHVRDKAALAFLWRTGIGVSELERVRMRDLDPATRTVHIRRTAQRRERDVFILGLADDPGWGWEQLNPWLERRARLGVVQAAPLFCIVEGPSKGGPIAAPHLRTAVKKYAKAAGRHGQFTLAGFRNTLAAEMYRAGSSVSQIQRQLGHDSVATTQTMLERIGVAQGGRDLSDYNPSGIKSAPPAHRDMPEDMRKVFEEARLIVDLSPRGAAALLRLSLQMLMVHLGQPGKDLNHDIGALVRQGLPIEVQQALDSVRVIGNESVHPGTLDLRDDHDTAVILFGLVNFIIEQRITQPKQIEALYRGLPSGKLKGIKERDRRR